MTWHDMRQISRIMIRYHVGGSGRIVKKAEVWSLNCSRIYVSDPPVPYEALGGG